MRRVETQTDGEGRTTHSAPTLTHSRWFHTQVRELDPQNKFAGLSDVWSWEGVDLERCCGPDGFSAQCKCDTQRSA